MGYFHRHNGRGPGHVEMSAEELRQWLPGQSDEILSTAGEAVPSTPYDRALLDAQSGSGRNLVVVVDHSGVIATVVETERGALWRPVVDRAEELSENQLSGIGELLEWDGERPTPLRLIARRRDEPAAVELDPDLVLGEVRVARATGKVQRLPVRAAAPSLPAAARR